MSILDKLKNMLEVLEIAESVMAEDPKVLIILEKILRFSDKKDEFKLIKINERVIDIINRTEIENVKIIDEGDEVKKRLKLEVDGQIHFCRVLDEKNKEKLLLCTTSDEDKLEKVCSHIEKIADKLRVLHTTKRKIFEDFLTGIYNRRALEAHLNKNSECVVLFFDIDRFKQINDSYGHLVGDQILKEVANIIKTSLRIQDSVYRYGGDEFVVLLSNTNKNQARRIAERIKRKIAEKIKIGGEPLSVSYGIASCSDKPSDIIKKADERMYRMKKKGRRGKNARKNESD